MNSSRIRHWGATAPPPCAALHPSGCMALDLMHAKWHCAYQPQSASLDPACGTE